MKKESTHRLTTIVAMDVADYSGLMGKNEAGALPRLKEYRSVIDSINEAHGGRLAGTVGDGLLLEFSNVVDAVTGVVEVQKALSELNSNLPNDEKMLFRIGVNLGDVLDDGDHIFGDGVNVAARIEARAAPGGISISGSVYENIRDHMDIPLEDMEDVEVKNITRPIQIFRILAEGQKISAEPQMDFKSQPAWWAIVTALVLILTFSLGAWNSGFLN
ncbi:MAG: adenylate/guanylate cyclase domain-containing protein [Rhizobiaceae bacterium]|nr:adenylate/guanylate cyclase domain-containing protein [Rhizobiaceae bacterium]